MYTVQYCFVNFRYFKPPKGKSVIHKCTVSIVLAFLDLYNTGTLCSTVLAFLDI
jgi:hypothetical protein